MISSAREKFLLIGMSHFSKLLSGFVLIKLIAHYLGAAGLGNLGHCLSILSIMSLFAGGGIGNSVIRYVSEFKDNETKLSEFLNTAFSYSFFFSFSIFLFVILFAGDFSGFIFKDKAYFWIVILLGLVQFFLSFLQILNGFFSGTSDIRSFSFVQIVGYSTSIVISWVFISRFGYVGGVLGVITVYTWPFIVAFFRATNFDVLKKIRLKKVCYDEIKPLLSYTLMLLTSAVSFPIVEMFIREKMLVQSGSFQAGLWQGMIKISSAYMGFFGAYLTYGFLPSISGLQDLKLVRIKILRVTLLLCSGFAIGAISFYLYREFFLVTLLSPEFIAVSDILVYQLIGDFFKVMSFGVAFFVLARSYTKCYILCEVFQYSLLFFLIYLPGIFDVRRIVIAQMFCSIIYSSLVIFGFWIYFKLQVKHSTQRD